MDSSDLYDKEPPLRPPPIWVADSIFGSENSSSGLSTPFGSLGSTRTETESDEDEAEDFIAELTRQMAGYTLQDEDEHEEDLNIVVQDHENISSPKFKESLVCYPDNKEPANTSVKFTSDSDYATHVMRPIESNPAQRGRRVTRTESTHQRVDHTAEPQPPYVAKKGRRRRSGHGGGRAHTLKNGLGMQAVFLGGSGYVSGAPSGGTGVFLPRGCNYNGQMEPKKKSGCSTVLIPTRVLQALQLHFSNLDAKSLSNTSAAAPSNSFAPNTTWNRTEDSISQSEQRSEVETPPAAEMLQQLPQEWTY